MKETIEHNNRFYTNEKGEIKTENEQLKEWLIIANKENERLNNRVNELEKAVSRKEEEITDLRDEIIDLESTIDEAIEYIDKNSYTTFETIDDINYFIVRLDKCADLLDILKGSDKE